MLRIVVREHGGAALPPIDVAEAAFVIGAGAAARVRLPASVARPEHVRVQGGRWASDDGGGEIGDGVELAMGDYRVAIAPAPAGAVATPPQRTASLARELLRGVLGDDGAPTLEVVDGPLAGARRRLAPPESLLVIGRDAEAGWLIADERLSRVHAEVRRSWDGFRVVDAGSASGTWVDERRVSEAVLHDGAVVRVGGTTMRFVDVASRKAESGTGSDSGSGSGSGSDSGSDSDAGSGSGSDSGSGSGSGSGSENAPPRWQLYAAVAVISAAVAAALWVAIT